MGSRLDLHTVLTTVLGSDHVYFQPPESIQMEYPCIVYSRQNLNTLFADNVPYTTEKQYAVTVIDPDPDSLIPDKVAKLPKCRFSRHFTADNLNHELYNLFF